MRFRNPDMEALAAELEAEHGGGRIILPPPGAQFPRRRQKDISREVAVRRDIAFHAWRNGKRPVEIAARWGVSVSLVRGWILREKRDRWMGEQGGKAVYGTREEARIARARKRERAHREQSSQWQAPKEPPRMGIFK